MIDLLELTTEKVQTFERVNAFKEFSKEWTSEDRFNPLKMYCASTGRCIGTLNDDALYMLLATIPSNTPMTALYERVCEMNLISSKCSPAWVYQTTESIRTLIKQDPTGACVFYLTRAYQQGNKQLMQIRVGGKTRGKQAHQWTNYSDHMEWNRIRIEMFHTLAAKYSQKALQATAELMLEVDARVGLANCKMPTESLYNLVERRILSVLIKHYKKILRKVAKQEIQYQPDGHTQSRLAFQFYKGIRKKPTQKDITNELKKAKHSEMNDIFNEVMHLNNTADAIHAKESGYEAGEDVKKDLAAIAEHAHAPIMQKATKGFSFKGVSK